MKKRRNGANLVVRVLLELPSPRASQSNLDTFNIDKATSLFNICIQCRVNIGTLPNRLPVQVWPKS